MTPRLQLAFVAGLALAAAATFAYAQDSVPPPPASTPDAQHHKDVHHRHMPDWMAMDTDHDGRISAAEHAAWAKSQFDQLDANHDGYVTPDELHAHMQAKIRERAAKMFDRIDTNHDGSISRDEMQAAMLKMHGRMHGDHGMDAGRHDAGMHDDGMDDMPPPPPPPSE